MINTCMLKVMRNVCNLVALVTLTDVFSLLHSRPTLAVQSCYTLYTV